MYIFGDLFSHVNNEQTLCYIFENDHWERNRPFFSNDKAVISFHVW